MINGFSDKKMSGLLFGPQKSCRNDGANGLEVWWGSAIVVTKR